MGEIRRDPLSGEWVIFATGEGFTSRDFLLRRNGGLVEEESCPLCVGQEKRTPPELFAVGEPGRAPDTPGWSVRVIPDRLPLLEPGATGPLDTSPTHQLRPAQGHHELIVLSPIHNRDLGDMSTAEAEVVLRVLRDRYLRLVNYPGVKHVVLLINRGREAGASLLHPHAQAFALPFIPEDLKEELERSLQYIRATGACLLCSEIREELKAKQRIAIHADDFIAWVPFAARLPFELVVARVSHGSRFEEIEGRALKQLAAILTELFHTLDKALDDPPYNLVLHSAPLGKASDLSYHWHLEIFPRLTIAANFELASDVWVNSVAPEDAAAILREHHRAMPRPD